MTQVSGRIGYLFRCWAACSQFPCREVKGGHQDPAATRWTQQGGVKILQAGKAGGGRWRSGSR
uniref:Uncharacterized protein n=1 Tax=Setaria italica TaxID=4555 RepID=K3ZGD6_SETIT